MPLPKIALSRRIDAVLYRWIPSWLHSILIAHHVPTSTPARAKRRLQMSAKSKHWIVCILSSQYQKEISYQGWVHTPWVCWQEPDARSGLPPLLLPSPRLLVRRPPPAKLPTDWFSEQKTINFIRVHFWSKEWWGARFRFNYHFQVWARTKERWIQSSGLFHRHLP